MVRCCWGHLPSGAAGVHPNPKALGVSQAAHRADGHPTAGQGTSLGNGTLQYPPASPTCSSRVRTLRIQRRPLADVRDGAARSRALPSADPPVPGLTRLAGGCLQGRRGRLEEKQDRHSAPSPLPVRAAPARVGGHRGGGLGRTDTRCFCFPAGRCTWPAQEPHASPSHGATAGSGRWLPAQPDKKGCRERGGVRT